MGASDEDPAGPRPRAGTRPPCWNKWLSVCLWGMMYEHAFTQGPAPHLWLDLPPGGPAFDEAVSLIAEGRNAPAEDLYLSR